jgi:hypothetical protein
MYFHIASNWQKGQFVFLIPTDRQVELRNPFSVEDVLREFLAAGFQEDSLKVSVSIAFVPLAVTLNPARSPDTRMTWVMAFRSSLDT